MTNFIMHTLFISQVNKEHKVLIYDDCVDQKSMLLKPEKLYQQHQALLRKKHLNHKVQSHFLKSSPYPLTLDDIHNPNVQHADIETDFATFLQKLKSWKD